MKTLRILSIALLVALCLGILAGCGKKAEETPKTDRNKWQDTLHLKTYDEVEAVLGKPDTDVNEKPQYGAQYRNVSFAGVPGIYWIGSIYPDSLREGIVESREFCYAVELENKTVQEIHDDAQEKYETICKYLTDTYGECIQDEDSSAPYWSYTAKDGTVVKIFANWLWSNTPPDIDTSDWQTQPGTTLLGENKEIYEAFGNCFRVVTFRFYVKSPK